MLAAIRDAVEQHFKFLYEPALGLEWTERLYYKQSINQGVHGMYFDIPSSGFQRSYNDRDFKDEMIIEASGILANGTDLKTHKKLSGNVELPALEKIPKNGFTANA